MIENPGTIMQWCLLSSSISLSIVTILTIIDYIRTYYWPRRGGDKK